MMEGFAGSFRAILQIQLFILIIRIQAAIIQFIQLIPQNPSSERLESGCAGSFPLSILNIPIQGQETFPSDISPVISVPECLVFPTPSTDPDISFKI
jgi:hypothetical protein